MYCPDKIRLVKKLPALSAVMSNFVKLVRMNRIALSDKWNKLITRITKKYKYKDFVIESCERVVDFRLNEKIEMTNVRKSF